jgi:hypothetical protein
MFIRKKKYNELVSDALSGKRANIACAETLRGYRNALKCMNNERDMWQEKWQTVCFEFTNYKRDRGDIDMSKNLKDVTNRIIEMKKILNLNDSQIKRVLEIAITNEITTYDVTKAISYIRNSNNTDEVTDDMIELANYAIRLDKRGWDYNEA